MRTRSTGAVLAAAALASVAGWAAAQAPQQQAPPSPGGDIDVSVGDPAGEPILDTPEGRVQIGQRTTAVVAGPPRFLVAQTSLYAANAQNALEVLRDGAREHPDARAALETQARFVRWSVAAAAQGAQQLLDRTGGERGAADARRGLSALRAAYGHAQQLAQLAAAGRFGEGFDQAARSAAQELRAAQTAIGRAAQPFGAADALTRPG